VSATVSSRLLYWTERQADDDGRLMRCRLDGSDLRTVIRHRRQGPRHSRSTSSSTLCSCQKLAVASSFAIDYTRPVSRPQIYVVDSDTGDIWRWTDKPGCHCQLIVNATTLSLTSSDIGVYTMDYCNSATNAVIF